MHGRRAVCITVALIVAAQFCGCFVMLNYTAEIFAQAGATISSNVATIIMGVVQLLGAYVSTVLVDRTGRKFLLIGSALGSAVALLTMGGFMRAQQFGYDLSACAWLPMVSFGALAFLSNCGLMTLPFLVIGEVLPDRVRSAGQSLAMTLMYVISTVLLKVFPLMVTVLSMSGALFVFAGSCLAAVAFVWVRVPETKGKSFEAIRRMMEK